MSFNINDESFDFDILRAFDLANFLNENKHLKPESFLLHSKYNTKKLNWFLAEQLKTYPKANHKLPTFTATHCWFTSKSYEQSSSESSALFKSTLFKGAHLLDLSGGLGVDDWAFANSFDTVLSLDPDTELNELVRLNWHKLNTIHCSRLDTTAEAFIQENPTRKFDLIYLDADRRSTNSRQLSIHEGSPNFFEIQAQLFQMSGQILLKLSPLIDINYCLKELPFINKIWIVSIQHEVKELLCYLNQNSSDVQSIHVIEIDKDGEIHELNSTQQESAFEPLGQTVESKSIFFEPSAALIKSGLSHAYLNHYQFQSIGINTLYFKGTTPDVALQNHGRFFNIIHEGIYSKSKFTTYLKMNGITKMNISTRNFGMDADTLINTLKLKTGGNDYFFFGRNTAGEKLFFHCSKIANN